MQSCAQDTSGHKLNLRANQDPFCLGLFHSIIEHMLAVSGVFIGILQPMDEFQDMEHFRWPIYIKNDPRS